MNIFHRHPRHRQFLGKSRKLLATKYRVSILYWYVEQLCHTILAADVSRLRHTKRDVDMSQLCSTTRDGDVSPQLRHRCWWRVGATASQVLVTCWSNCVTSAGDVSEQLRHTSRKRNKYVRSLKIFWYDTATS